jgi:hypothetical protein
MRLQSLPRFPTHLAIYGQTLLLLESSYGDAGERAEAAIGDQWSGHDPAGIEERLEPAHG